MPAALGSGVTNREGLTLLEIIVASLSGNRPLG
jgi:hypothetical protein